MRTPEEALKGIDRIIEDRIREHGKNIGMELRGKEKLAFRCAAYQEVIIGLLEQLREQARIAQIAGLFGNKN